jgi:YidC/Oxa1 family membrane protein insertase
MDNNKRLIAFFLASSLMLAVYVGLNYWWAINHPPKRPERTPVERVERKWPFATSSAREQHSAIADLAIASLAGGSGPDQVGRLATDVAVLANHLPPVDPWPWTRRSRDVQRAVIANLAALAPSGPGFDQAARVGVTLAQLIDAPPVPRPVEVPEITLGDDENFFLKVRLSAHGASVRNVILNRFQAADGYGLPVWKNREGPRNTENQQPLKLVPDHRVKIRSELTDPDKQPIEYDQNDPFYHYQLFVYAKPDDDRPLDTLGNATWTLVKKDVQPGAEHQEAAFSHDVYDADGRPLARITKVYSLNKGDYHVGLTVRIENLQGDSKEKPKLRYQLAGAHGLPIEGEWYTTTLRNSLIGTVDKNGSAWRDLEDSRTIAHKEGGDRIPPTRADMRIQYGGVAVQYFASMIVVDDQQEKKDFLEWARPTLELGVSKGQITQRTASSFFLKTSANEGTLFQIGPSVPLRTTLFALREGANVNVIWKQHGDDRVALNLLSDDVAIPTLLEDVTVRVVSEPLPLEPTGAVEHKYLLYNGPIKVRLLGQLKGPDAVNPELVERYEHTLHLNTMTDYRSSGPFGVIGEYTGLGWLIIKFTNLMHGILDFLHTRIFPWSYGICIILLTVLVRGVMFPITRRQTRVSKDMQEKMQKLQPELKKLKEKYKEDPFAMYQEQQELFRRHNINQFAMMGGCLPVLAQMPIFLGLYYCLQESISFRLEPFFPWMSWWIPNLAAPDMLQWWSEKIPMISQPASQGGMLFLGPFFNLLPVIAVGLMLVQQTLMAPPAADEQQEMQMKMMKWMMVIFGIMFYKVAAGLCVYFIASSLWGLAERKLLGKKPVAAPAPAGASDSDSSGNGARLLPKPPKPRPEPKGPPSEGGLMQRLRGWWGDILKEAAKQQQARRDDGGGDSRKKKRRDDEPARRRGRS